VKVRVAVVPRKILPKSKDVALKRSGPLPVPVTKIFVDTPERVCAILRFPEKVVIDVGENIILKF